MVSPRSVRIGSVLGVVAGLGAAACAGIIGIDDRQLDPLLGPDGSILPEAGRDGVSPNDSPTTGDSPNPPPPDGGDGGAGACTRAAPCVLAVNQNHPNEMAIDSNNVYWTNYGTMTGTSDGTVVSCSINGCNQTPNVIASGLVNPAELVVDGQNVYWTEVGSGKVNSCPLAGCNGTITTLAMGLNRPIGIAVDGNFVYWADANDATISKVPKGGGMTTVLVPSMGGLTKPSYLAVDATSIFIGDDFNGIMKVPLAGGTATVVDGTAGCPCFPTLDPTSVYYSSQFNGSIVKTARTSADGGTALVTGQNNPVQVRLDTASNSLYWANYGSGSAADGTVAKVPSGGGSTTSLATNQDPTIATAVDGTSVYWITNGMVSGMTTAPMTGTLFKAPK